MERLLKVASAAAFGTAVLVLAPTTPALAADSTVELTLTPSTTQPGTTVQVEAKFTATAAATFDVNVGLFGTGGQGTFLDPGSTPNLDCKLGDPRSYTCTWNNAQIGATRTITLTLNVGAGAVIGQQWSVNATSNPNLPEADGTTELLTIAAPPTTAPTTAPTSDSGSGNADGSGEPAVPTAVPAGAGPASGSPMPVTLALLMFLMAVAAVTVPLYRSGKRTH